MTLELGVLEAHDGDPYRYGERLLAQYTVALDEAVQVGYGADPETTDWLEVFPEPTTPRDAAPLPEWTDEQAGREREIVDSFGVNRETDRTITEVGLRGAHAVYQAGQPHKIRAEVEAVLEDAGAAPSSHIFCGNPSRRITNAGEQESARRQLGFVPETEYDVARLIAEQMPGFVPRAGGDEVWGLSYDIDSDFATGQEATGQFVLIGHIGNPDQGGKPVVMFRVDQAPVSEPGQRPKQPTPSDTMRIISEAQSFLGDEDTPLAFVTSATYRPSTEVEAIRAGLATGRIIGVPAYGRAHLARVKGDQAPQPVGLNQIPGELHAMALAVRLLDRELRTPFEKRLNLRHAIGTEAQITRTEAILLAVIGNMAISQEVLDPYRFKEDRA